MSGSPPTAAASSGAPVAVIDIGSNSIKTLVAQRGDTGAVEALFSRSIEVRISADADWQAGRSQLAPKALDAALEALVDLLHDCAAYAPAQIALVGTSALRDAANGQDFSALVRAHTGHAIQILSGEEEAAAIGRGLLCDPELQGVAHAYAFDLGGGSLECLALHGGAVTAAQSLPLGSVRLLRAFVANPEAALADSARAAIRAHVAQKFARAGFHFEAAATALAASSATASPPTLAAAPFIIGTGGLWFNVRQMLAAIDGSDDALAPPFIPRVQIERVLEIAAALPLAERRALPGISPGRADILPTALTTMLAVLDLGNGGGLQHSAYNLRYGVASALLDAAH